PVAARLPVDPDRLGPQRHRRGLSRGGDRRAGVRRLVHPRGGRGQLRGRLHVPLLTDGYHGSDGYPPSLPFSSPTSSSPFRVCPPSSRKRRMLRCAPSVRSVRWNRYASSTRPSCSGRSAAVTAAFASRTAS